MFIRTLLIASISHVLGFAAFAEDVPLIPRETLFGNPERANVQISPDGAVRDRKGIGPGAGSFRLAKVHP